MLQFPRRCWKGLLPACLSIGFALPWWKLMTALCALSFLALKCKTSVKYFGIVWIVFVGCLWCCSTLDNLKLSTLHSSQSAWTLPGTDWAFAWHWLQCTALLLSMGNLEHVHAHKRLVYAPFHMIYWLVCLMIVMPWKKMGFIIFERAKEILACDMDRRPHRDSNASGVFEIPVFVQPSLGFSLDNRVIWLFKTNVSTRTGILFYMS